MPCSCIKTAIIKEVENEKLRLLIKILEYKIKKYQEELIAIYEIPENNSICQSTFQ